MAIKLKSKKRSSIIHSSVKKQGDSKKRSIRTKRRSIKPRSIKKRGGSKKLSVKKKRRSVSKKRVKGGSRCNKAVKRANMEAAQKLGPLQQCNCSDYLDCPDGHDCDKCAGCQNTKGKWTGLVKNRGMCVKTSKVGY